MNVRRIYILAMTLMVGTVWTSDAPVNQEDFTVFLRHFIREARFRAERTMAPLAVELSSGCEKEPNRSKERWNRTAIAKKLIVPLTHAALAAKGLDQQITELSSTEVRLFQFRDGADSYLLTYTFRARNGSWYLVAYEDASC